MASACAWSVALSGLEGRLVEVEADIGAGLPRTVLVGLPDSALYQSRDRCKAAVSNSGQEWPIAAADHQPVSPATLPKAGSHYDLAIVAAVLAAQGVLPRAGAAAHRPARRAGPGRPGATGPRRAAGDAGGRGGRLHPGDRAAAAGRRGRPGRGARRARYRLDHASWSRCCRGEPVPEVEPIEVRGRPHRRTRRAASSTWPTWSVRSRRSGPARWRRPGGTTCCSTVRPASARRCSPNGCRACCPTWTCTTRSRSPPCTRWPGSTSPTSW